VNNKIWRKCCKFVSPFYLITLTAYLCSHCSPNVRIKYFMFDCSIYGLFGLNRVLKLDSRQIMLFVNGCLTWNMVEIKTRFETGITKNEVNGLGLYNIFFNNKCETNIDHLRHFLLFASLNAFLVEPYLMSSKYLRISSFGENHVSSPNLAQIVCGLTNQI
jgi:hypothetical protein